MLLKDIDGRGTPSDFSGKKLPKLIKSIVPEGVHPFFKKQTRLWCLKKKLAKRYDKMQKVMVAVLEKKKKLGQFFTAGQYLNKMCVY